MFGSHTQPRGEADCLYLKEMIFVTEENQKNEQSTPQTLGNPVIPEQPKGSNPTPSAPVEVAPDQPENDEPVEVSPAEPEKLGANQRRWGGDLYEKTAENGWRKVS